MNSVLDRIINMQSNTLQGNIICEKDERTVKAVVKIALEKYFEDRNI